MKRKRVKRLLSYLMSLAMVFSMMFYPAMTIHALDEEGFGTNTEEVSEVKESDEEVSDVLEESETENSKVENKENLDGELLDEDSKEFEKENESELSNDEVMTLLEKGNQKESNLGTAISEAGGSFVDASYYLDDDVTLTNDITTSGTVTIDLNGHALTGTGTGPVITNTGTLTLKDSSSTQDGKLKGGNSDNGGAISNSGSFILESGTITANSGHYSAYYGTGNESQFTMTGGSITGNTSSIAAIRVGGNFTISGGSITNNQGKAIYLSNGSFTMNGGTISGNQATETSTNGGAIYVSSDSSLTMSAGVITDNTAGYGGGIYFDGLSQLSRTSGITGGVVYGNKASIEGGDIVIKNGYSVSLMSSALMSDKGYTFKGWYDDGSNNRYSQNENPTYYESVIASGDENYALINAYGYKLAYDAGQGSGTPDEDFLDLAKGMTTITVSTGETLTAPEGLCFNSWNTSLEGTGNSYQPGSEITLSQNTTLYGQYGSHSLIKTDAREATCTLEGNSEYWRCDNCHKYFSNAEGTNEIDENSWVISALKHNYSVDQVSFNWSDGYDQLENLNSITCKAIFTCSEGDETKEVECLVERLSENDYQATCTTPGNYSVKATATLTNPRDEQSLSASESKIINGVKLGHQWSEDASGVSFNWSEDGKSCVASMTCLREDCDVTLTQELSEESGITSSIKTPGDCTNDEVKTYSAIVTFIDENESEGYQAVGPFTSSKDVVQEGSALKHNYTTDNVTFIWSNDDVTHLNEMSAKALFTCSEGDETKEVECLVERLSENDQVASCTSAARYDVKASAELTNPRDGQTLSTSESKTLIGVKLGHLWPEESEGALFTWNEDGKTATATITCLREGCLETLTSPLSIGNGIEETVKNEADCVNDKVLTCTATAYFTDGNASEESQNIGPYTSSKDVVQKGSALKHNYMDSQVSFTWDDEYNDVEHLNEISAKATFTCSEGDDTKEVECTLEHIIANDHAATCTLADDYFVKATATLINPRDEATLTASENKILYGNKLGHMWPEDEKDVTFTWGEDNKTCTVSITCQRPDCNKTLTETLTEGKGITSLIKVQPDCITNEVLTYTAQVTFIDDNESAGHQAVGPYEESKDVIVEGELKGHIYDNEHVVFNWLENEDGRLSIESATFTCLDCGYQETVTSQATSQKTSDSTCEGNGTTLYTASASITSRDETTVQASAQKEASFPLASGHLYDFENATFEWAETKEGWDCQAIVTCLNDETHKALIDCDVNSTISTAPQCEDEGQAIYHASFTVDGKTYDSDETKTKPVLATGHDWQVKDSTIVEAGQEQFTVTYRCANCQIEKTETHVIGMKDDNNTLATSLKWNDLLTSDELLELLKDGSEINLALSVTPFNEEDVDGLEKEMIEDKINELYDNVKYVISYLNIDVNMSIAYLDGKEDVRSFEKTLNPLTITVEIPEKLASVQGDNYTVIRVHDGKVDQLDCMVEGNTLSFTSDLFSTYALIKYQIQEVNNGKEDIITDITKLEGTLPDKEKEEMKTSETVNTGDDNTMNVILLGLGLSLAAMAFLIEKKKRYNR